MTSLISRYMTLCNAAFEFCGGAKLNKSIRTNIMEMLFLLMAIPRKVNFAQMGRYGKHGEQCYRQTAERSVDWLKMNTWLCDFTFKDGKGRKAIAIDPSYIKKSGKCTPHIGSFWSGCAGAVKRGLEDLDMSKVKAIDVDGSTGNVYALKAWCKSLGKEISLVIHFLPGGGHRLYFSTDKDMDGRDVMEYYCTRFQIEFCFRDAKQFAGLTDCQARDVKKLDFAFNSSFTAVNVAKIVGREYGLSVGRLKELIVSAYYAQRIIDVFESNPNKPLNIEMVNEIFGVAADAA